MKKLKRKIKTVVITGGGSGLGRAMAIRWAASGADICIADINQSRASQVVDEVKSQGVDAFYFACDISHQREIELLKTAVAERWKSIDLVINNAGIASADALVDESMEQWQQILAINLLGAVKVSQVFTPLFRSQGFGYFLNIASQAGLTPIPMMASYNASKAALISFSETMRLELEDDQIGVSVLCPSFFKTNLNESLKTSNAGLARVLDKMMVQATITAEQVADIAFHAVNKGEFLILSHPIGKRVFRFKRWFPQQYLKMMVKQTKRIRSTR